VRTPAEAVVNEVLEQSSDGTAGQIEKVLGGTGALSENLIWSVR
jgi:hypothetical protein